MYIFFDKTRFIKSILTNLNIFMVNHVFEYHEPRYLRSQTFCHSDIKSRPSKTAKVTELEYKIPVDSKSVPFTVLEGLVAEL